MREVIFWLQQAGRDSAQGNMPNAMRRTGMLYIKVRSNPLFSKCCLSFCSLLHVSASFFAFFFPHSELFIYK